MQAPVYQPIYTPDKKEPEAGKHYLTSRFLYGMALLISFVSWITCIVLLSTSDNIVENYTYDTRLALFISRNESDFCGNSSLLQESACPADILDRFTHAYSHSPCTKISPIDSHESTSVSVKWGDNHFFRYPLIVDAHKSTKFWGRFLSGANSLVLLLFVFTVSLLFQGWRYVCFKKQDNDLGDGQQCPYDFCQHNESTENTWTKTLEFRPIHGSSFSMWFEYTWTASIQLLVVAFNFQGSSVNELWFIVLIQGCLTLLGFIVENSLDSLYMPCKHQHGNALLYGDRRYFSLFWRAVCVEIVAWFLHATLWVSLFSNFDNVKSEVKNLQTIGTGSQCRHDHKIPDVPGWVQAVIYSQFVFYTSFGVVQLTQFIAFAYENWRASLDQNQPGFETRWRQKNLRVWKTSAYAYAVLNVVSKAFLAFILVAGTVMN